jgi:BMFP domain-containing protein YqiC
MQTRNRLLDDLAKAAGGALSVMTGVKSEAEAVLRQQFEKVLDKMDLVPREDFEAVRTMVAKARDQQEELTKRAAVLEAALNIKPPQTRAKGSATMRKTAAKSTPKKAAPKKGAKATRTKGAKG